MALDMQLLRARVQAKLRALNVSYQCLTPIVILPVFLYVAALGRELSILAFLLMPVLLYAMHLRTQRQQYRSRFFYVWSLWSVLFGYVLFQSTVPMMEVLPEENILFLLCLVLTVFLFYKTKSFAFNKAAYWPTVIATNVETNAAAAIPQTAPEEEEAAQHLIDTDEERGAGGGKGGSADAVDVESGGGGGGGAANRIYQCNICQMGVPELDHHSVWLDCCVGGSNRKFYLLGCVMALITLLLEANLSLTSICHPYLIANVFGVHILMPDDCSDVFDQYDIAVCFVTSVYCLLLAAYVFIAIVYQAILISRGTTATEWKLKIPTRTPQRSIYANWVNYVRN